MSSHDDIFMVMVMAVDRRENSAVYQSAIARISELISELAKVTPNLIDTQELYAMTAYSGQKSQVFRFKPASHSDSKKPLSICVDCFKKAYACTSRLCQARSKKFEKNGATLIEKSAGVSACAPFGLSEVCG